jgi:hypothetical protein
VRSETQLTRLDELIDAETKHQSETTRLAEEKARILDGRGLDKQQRINKVGKLLAAVEVENADLRAQFQHPKFERQLGDG